MFEEMGKAVFAFGLVARANVGEQPDRDCLDFRHLAAGDVKAIGKDRELHHSGGVLGSGPINSEDRDMVIHDGVGGEG